MQGNSKEKAPEALRSWTYEKPVYSGLWELISYQKSLPHPASAISENARISKSYGNILTKLKRERKNIKLS